MARVIKCTNPSCEAGIDVPAGAAQVICDDCGTWHFPTPEKSDSPTDGDYRSSSVQRIAHDVADNTGNESASEQYVLPPEMVEERVVETENESDANVPLEMEQTQLREDFVAAETEEPNISDAGFLLTETGERLRLQKGINVIGRTNADLTIDDKTVSRRHCVVEVNEGSKGGLEYAIYDIGHLEGNSSTNGVFISGRSLRLQDYERIPLRNGAHILIGNVQLELSTYKSD